MLLEEREEEKEGEGRRRLWGRGRGDRGGARGAESGTALSRREGTTLVALSECGGKEGPAQREESGLGRQDGVE
jgi:hypothetical protein